MKPTYLLSAAVFTFAFAVPIIVHATTQAVPTALAKLEGSAEDTYDLAIAGEFAKVSKNAIDISTTWARYRSQASRDGVSQKVILAMDGSVSALRTTSSHAKLGDNVNVARVADAVSGDMDQFYIAYRPTTPPGVMKLDFLGRELVLDGMASDYSMATKQLGEINGAWRKLRLLIMRAGGAKEAKIYDQAYQALQTHLGTRDSAALINDAKISLEDLDAMEKLFP